jgi:hypothetical protein
MSFLGPLSSYTLPAAGLLLPFVAGMTAKEPEPPRIQIDPPEGLPLLSNHDYRGKTD